LNPIIRILARTDGSVTTIIEALTGMKAEIKTLEQRIVKANKELANILDINEGEEVNYRVVEINSGGIMFARAISFSPLKRLDKSFRDDLMKADIPIGKIIKKHRLEVRREILWSDIRDVNEMGMCLVRNYNIFHKGKVLINITEQFPLSAFERFRW